MIAPPSTSPSAAAMSSSTATVASEPKIKSVMDVWWLGWSTTCTMIGGCACSTPISLPPDPAADSVYWSYWSVAFFAFSAFVRFRLC